MRLPEPAASDPLVAGAAAARRLDLEHLPRDEDGVVEIHGTRHLPSMSVEADGSAMVRWYRPEGMLVYTLDGEGGIMTIEGAALAATLLEGIVGRPLSCLVDVPGSDRMTIVEGVTSHRFPGDPLDTRLAVRRDDAPPAGDGIIHADGGFRP